VNPGMIWTNGSVPLWVLPVGNQIQNSDTYSKHQSRTKESYVIGNQLTLG